MINLKIPYLKISELDAAANELLRGYSKWKGSVAAPPIDVDEIVEGYLGLVLEIADLEKRLGIPDVLGASWFDERRICVDQSLEGLEGRFSFTLAHEVGHWVLHRPLHEANKVPGVPAEARAAEPAIVSKSSQRQAPAEWQANQFAARLLMPATTRPEGRNEARWLVGAYEDRYVREHGVWLFEAMNLHVNLFAPHQGSWADTAVP